MADDGVGYTTKILLVFSKTEPIVTGDFHNLEIRSRRRRVTRIRDSVVSDEATGDLEEDVYIPSSIFLCFDDLAIELNRTLCGRLGLNLDDGSVNGVAEVVRNNLRAGVCDEVRRTVVVVIVEVVEVEVLPDLEYVDDEDELDQLHESEYEDAVEECAEDDVVRLEIDVDLSELCAICWDVFAAGSGVLKLPCDHLFHEVCITAWFERKWNCPMCRKLVKVNWSTL